MCRYLELKLCRREVVVPHLTLLLCFVPQDEKRKQLMMHKIILLASEHSSWIFANLLECSILVYMYMCSCLSFLIPSSPSPSPHSFFFYFSFLFFLLFLFSLSFSSFPSLSPPLPSGNLPDLLKSQTNLQELATMLDNDALREALKKSLDVELTCQEVIKAKVCV